VSCTFSSRDRRHASRRAAPFCKCLYIWQDREAYENFLAGELWAEVLKDDSMLGTESHHFAVMEGSPRPPAVSESRLDEQPAGRSYLDPCWRTAKTSIPGCTSSRDRVHASKARLRLTARHRVIASSGRFGDR
jgi:hypothetical protein